MTANKGSVRIIGGEHRGRRLHFTDQNGDLRPTGDRLRETLFNWLQFEVRGTRVLDLFAGSGALAAEALSRGAASALLIEKKRARADDLARVLTPVFDSRAQVKCVDALTWVNRACGQYDLVFRAPPYDLGLHQPICDALAQHDVVAPGGWIFIETRRQSAAPNVPAHWQLEKEKESGDVRAQLYRNGERSQ
jgi:16S rRNA (guanine966-N2)-methyltransferase